jgi:hypothetical protein
LKKEFQSIFPSVRPTKSLLNFLKEGENLVGELRDVFPTTTRKVLFLLEREKIASFSTSNTKLMKEKKIPLQNKSSKKTKKNNYPI